jgi:hypothetical protein
MVIFQLGIPETLMNYKNHGSFLQMIQTDGEFRDRLFAYNGMVQCSMSGQPPVDVRISITFKDRDVMFFYLRNEMREGDEADTEREWLQKKIDDFDQNQPPQPGQFRFQF